MVILAAVFPPVNKNLEEYTLFLEIQSQDENLTEIIKRKAQPYFERGYNAVIEGRTLRTFGEAADIIKPKLLEYVSIEWWAEALACTFARSYIAGIVAAARLVAPELVAQFTPCLEEVST